MEHSLTDFERETLRRNHYDAGTFQSIGMLEGTICTAIRQIRDGVSRDKIATDLKLGMERASARRAKGKADFERAVVEAMNGGK